VALFREKRYKVFIEISEGKRSLGISVHRWEDNIENEICLAEDRDQWQPIVNVVINLSCCKMQREF